MEMYTCKFGAYSAIYSHDTAWNHNRMCVKIENLDMTELLGSPILKGWEKKRTQQIQIKNKNVNCGKSFWEDI